MAGISSHPMPRAIGHVDQAVLDRHAVEAFGDVVPEGFEAGRVFEGDEVVGHRRGHLDQRRKTKDAVGGAVRGDGDAVQVGVFGDPFHLGDAAHVAGIGADHVDRVAFDQVLVVLAQVDLLAGMDRRGRGAGHLAVDVMVDVGRSNRP